MTAGILQITVTAYSIKKLFKFVSVQSLMFSTILCIQSVTFSLQSVTFRLQSVMFRLQSVILDA